MKFVVLQDTNTGWYWELRETGGPPVARCALGFGSRQAALRNIQTVRQRAANSLIFDALGNLEKTERIDTERDM